MTSYTLPNNLSGGYETQDGSVWFTDLKNPLRFHNNQWTRYGPEDGALDSTFSVYKAHNNDLWFIGGHLGESAIARYKDHTWQIFTPSDGIIDNLYDTPLETKNGDLWFTGSHKGRAAVVRFDGTKWQRFANEFKGEKITRSYQASDGTIWFGTSRPSEGNNTRNGDGVIRFDGSTWTQYTVNHGMANGTIHSITEWPKGLLWVGSSTGISSIDLVALESGENWTHYSEDFFGVILPKIGELTPTNDALYARFYPNRNSGVIRYDGKDWHRITQQNGLVHSAVNTILKTKKGTLFFTTRGGLTRSDGQHWTHYVDEYQSIIDVRSLDIMREMKDGSIWALARNVALHFNPNDNLTSPETTLKAAPDLVSSAGNTLISWTGADKWNRTLPSDMRYEYRLNDSDWISTGNTPDHTFTGLADGAHRVEVRAINRYGIPDPSPAVQHFIVESPWWRNPYVIGIGVLLFSLTTLQTTRLVRRDRRLRETNAALSNANNKLYTLNQNLQEANTALEEANEEIQTTSKLKSRFLATMSHELRTPMNSIIGFTRLVLRRSENLEERQSENLTKVLQSADHLLNLINDVLDLSKIEADRMDIKPEPFNVKNLITTCCATVSPLVRNTVELTYQIDDNVNEANTDSARLRQIMINLLSNALKFTEKGEVKVDCRLGGEAEEGMLEIAVIDTGIGIPEDQLETIFDEFRQVDGSSTRKVQGTGLGLSICRKLCELMGGTITASSKLNKGSTFTVQIPLEYKEP